MEKLRKANKKIEEEIARLKEEERKRSAEKDSNMGALSAQKSYMEDRIKVRSKVLKNSKTVYQFFNVVKPWWTF